MPDDVNVLKSKNRRVQMDLSERDFERLMKLKDLSEAVSYSEVLKDALRLYEFVINKDIEGTKFYIKEGSDDMVRIEFFGLKA